MSDLDQIQKELEAKLERYKEEFVKEVVARVKQRTPVRTGALRDGVTGQVMGDHAEFYNSMPYSDVIENGDEHHRPVGMYKTTIAEAPSISELAARRAGLK